MPAKGKVWLHPYDKATKYTPAYETYFVNGVPAGTPSPNEDGWAFPLLFRNADASYWALITEAATDGTYCGCRLEQDAPGGLYRIRFPDEGEGNYTGRVNPSSTLPWATPWRVIVVGESLGTIVGSTLVNNLSPPSIVKDTSWIKPGRASWSWLFDHDSPQDHDKLRKGGQWFIGCLSGQNVEQEIDIDPSFLGSGKYKAIIITDGTEPRTFDTNERTVTLRDRLHVEVPKHGGFVIQLKPLR